MCDMLNRDSLGQLRDNVVDDEGGVSLPANVGKPNPRPPKSEKSKKEKTPRQALEAVT